MKGARFWLIAALGCADSRSTPGPLTVPDPCDGKPLVPYYHDKDGDGFGRGPATESCEAPGGFTTLTGDCDDRNAKAFPGAVETCDDAYVDRDCDGLIARDEPVEALGAVERWPDVDGDGQGAVGAPTLLCAKLGFVENGLDCDDTNASIYDGAPERCDRLGVDEDCDGLAGEDDAVGAVGAVEVYEDGDGDGDGAFDGLPATWCYPPSELAPTHGDCDDADPFTRSGVAFEDPAACIEDVDGDGWGATTPVGLGTPGGDCDDAEPSVYPEAPEVPNDAVDQDCSGADWDGRFYDDFEAGAPASPVFAPLVGDTWVQATVVANGSFALRLGGGGGIAETRAFDTSACDLVVWQYLGKRGPETPDVGDALVTSWWDGTAWVVGETWFGRGVTDATFSARSVVLDDPSARSPAFKLQFVSSGSGLGHDDFYVDDFELRCDVDADRDGAFASDDCDDLDPDHWSDCGLCQDGDLDGFGSGCDRGDDCDDLDDAVHPGVADGFGDGLDANCDGVDGMVLADDFELGAPDPLVWSVVVAPAVVDGWDVANGSFALTLSDGGLVETAPLDASTGCPNPTWSFLGQRGPEIPDAGDEVLVEWWDGTAWRADAVWEGGEADPGFALIAGVLSDPAAEHADLRLRLTAIGAGPLLDHFHLDDFVFGCGTDADGDDAPSLTDCDDADAAHWSDCGSCVDADQDGFGVDCDLGTDCDDAAGAIHPNALDVAPDGVDQDCDGLDGIPLWQDDFEDGVLDPARWTLVSGDAGVQSSWTTSGTFGLRLGGGGGTAVTVPIDTTPCTAVAVSWSGKRGPEQPEVGDDVTVDFGGVANWTPLGTWYGGALDPGFGRVGFDTSDPAALIAGLSVQFASSGSAAGYDDFWLDDLSIGCAP